MISNLRKENYRKGFLVRRLSKIVIPYAVVTLFYFFFECCEKPGRIRLFDVFIKIWNGNPIVSNSWYVIVIILFYLFFYLTMLVFGKRKKPIVISVFAFCVCWIAFCVFRNFASWWYNTVFVLGVGVAYAAYQNKISNYIRRFYWLKFAVSLLVFSSFFTAYQYVQHIGTRFFIVASTSVLASLSFSVLFIVACEKLEFHNPITKFLGNISFEIYLLHGFFISLYRSPFLYIESDFWWVVLVLLSTILLAFVLHLIFGSLFKSFGAVGSAEQK